MGFFLDLSTCCKAGCPFHVDALLNFGSAGPRAGSSESRSSQACARRPIRVCAKLNTRDSRGMTPRAPLRLRVGQPAPRRCDWRFQARHDAHLSPAVTAATTSSPVWKPSRKLGLFCTTRYQATAGCRGRVSLSRLIEKCYDFAA